MKTVQYLSCLVAGMIGILLIWQATLIALVMKENVLGVQSECPSRESTQNACRIPRVIHQMWKTSNLSSYPIDNSHSEWRRLFPDYDIRLWTDAQLDELMLSNAYLHLNSIYRSYPHSIQRSDLARLVILHRDGGIYADLDVFPVSRQVEALRLSNVSLLVPRSSTGSSLINHFLVAEPSSPILGHILQQFAPVPWTRRIYLSPYLDVFSTGSIFLTRVLRQWIFASPSSSSSSSSSSSPSCGTHLLWVMPEDQIKDYVEHRTGRSWHSLDGLVLNHIVDKPRLSLFFLVDILLFVSLLVKHRVHLYKIVTRQ